MPQLKLWAHGPQSVEPENRMKPPKRDPGNAAAGERETEEDKAGWYLWVPGKIFDNVLSKTAEL